MIRAIDRGATFGDSESPTARNNRSLAISGSFDDSNHENPGGKYIRKRVDQRSVLQKAFDENPNWSYPFKMKLATDIGMTLAQVAKWNWDMRKKHGLEVKNDRKKK